jgi:outer membrane biogenesis lipoprotein LolB
MSTLLPPPPTFTFDTVAVCLQPEAEIRPAPSDHVTIARTELERLMAMLTEMQDWQADYERLKEKERIELLVPFPIFMGLDND